MAKQPLTTAPRAMAVQNPRQIATVQPTREALLRDLWDQHNLDGSAR